MPGKQPKVAIVHYWLVSMRGGEKVVDQLVRVFPQADIFTLVCLPERLSEAIRSRPIKTSFLQKLPKATSLYQNFLPLMPLAIEQFDLAGYDIVISSDASVAKGAVTGPDTLHINYCHSPMRYAWDMYHDYMEGLGLGRLKKIAMAITMNYMRMWDVAASNRVDLFVANSEFVKGRIRKHYRREADVINPPVDVDGFTPQGEPGDFYLILGQIIPYKRIDVAVDAFNRSGRKLIIIGEGSEVARLKAMAGPNVSLIGHQPFDVIRDHYRRCKAFIFPGVEDFGITPLEAQASGRPVLAYRGGGALETVLEGKTGLFFEEQTAESLNGAVDRFERGDHAIDPQACVANAARYSESRFRERIGSYVLKAWDEHRMRTMAPSGKEVA